MKKYKNRVLDGILADALQAKDAVLIEGAKWCGKTTTAEQIAKSVIYLNDPKRQEQYLLTAQTNPQRLLEGDSPRLIDEWQIAPELWDVILGPTRPLVPSPHFWYTTVIKPVG